MPKNKDSTCNEMIFDKFFRSQATSLRNYLYYKFGDLDKAEDLVQDAFIKLWSNCAKVPLEKAKSYVYTVATNLAINITRHQQVKFKYANYIVSSKSDRTNESPEFVILEKEYEEKLKNAIARLSDRQREVFLLNRIEKKT